MNTMDIGYDLASFFGGTGLLIVVGVALDTLSNRISSVNETL